jgi:hypothetical protein
MWWWCRTWDKFFGYFGTVLKCVRLCGDGAASSWLGSSFFYYFGTILKCVSLCGNGAELGASFFDCFDTVLKYVRLCSDGAASSWLGSSFFGYFGTNLKCVRLCGNGAGLVASFFDSFGTVLKCVRLCGDGAASSWLGSSFLAILALTWSVLACVVMVQDLGRVFFGCFGTILNCIRLGSDTPVIKFEYIEVYRSVF